MARIQLDAVAPEFTLENHQGQTVRLSDYGEQKHVILIFNRGFL